jgi:hypothetical protein
MIVHIVLFEPHTSLTQADRARLLEDLRGAAAAIPSVRRFRVGRRVQHGLGGYEQAMERDYQYAAVVEFDDRAGLETYLKHPAHEVVGRHFTASAAHAIAYDFEMREAADPDTATLV